MNKPEFRADLHCHTTCSDGTYSPEGILKLAKEIGLSGLSITDHDTIEAYKVAIPIAKDLQFPLISGVEFSAELKGISIHVLGYSFSLDNQDLLNLCEKHSLRRELRNQKILDKLKLHNMPISEDELKAIPSEHATIGRPHIAQALLNKGFVSSIQEAFQKYLGDDKPCFAPGEAFSVEETIKIIQAAGGFAIIAHPHLIPTSSLINRLLEMKFNGIEGYYGRFPRDQQQKWIKVAAKKQWLLTGGSDFHGEIKPYSHLGSSWVDEKTFQKLLERHQKNN